jgi:hypothetical protein
VKRPRAEWDFAYEPVAPGIADVATELDVVVATRVAVAPTTIRAALSELEAVGVVSLLDRAPLHWTRVRAAAASRRDVAGLLLQRGIPVRYVAPSRRGDMTLPPSLEITTSVQGPGALSARKAVRPLAWHSRPATRRTERPAEGGLWFLGPRGVGVERAVCGTGAGTRLAVVDDDVADIEYLELDEVVPVGLERMPAASAHGALMVGWAVGAGRPDGTRFVGVAPDASTRLYCVPKAGADVVSLPLAIVRAVLDGADVVLCATYVEGTTSPMLDDALEVAQRLGRRGRGAIVVLPTGRETSSPARSVHASLTLSLADPASDPRVHCVGPGSKDGGWFLWKDARGRLRPFANRGPAVRWLSPGDDLAYPFATRDRLFHAESSGAAAIAAGVALLVLGCNRRLRAHELHALLARTATPPQPASATDDALADPADLLPLGRDPDGHDAKCGYGQVHATRACLGARDPFALALTAMGEDDAARAWCARAGRHYSPRLARWAVSVLLARSDLEHAARVVLRHVRLVAASPMCGAGHSPGATARQLALLLRELVRARRVPALLREELERAGDFLGRPANAARIDATVAVEATAVFGDHPAAPPGPPIR